MMMMMMIMIMVMIMRPQRNSAGYLRTTRESRSRGCFPRLVISRFPVRAPVVARDPSCRSNMVAEVPIQAWNTVSLSQVCPCWRYFVSARRLPPPPLASPSWFCQSLRFSSITVVAVPRRPCKGPCPCCLPTLPANPRHTHPNPCYGGCFCSFFLSFFRA